MSVGSSPCIKPIILPSILDQLAEVCDFVVGFVLGPSEDETGCPSDEQDVDEC